jgi:hypothetical protein
VIRKFTWAASLCASIAPAAHALTVSVPEKSQPESITVAGKFRWELSLYENNVIFNKLYRVPMDAGGKAGKPVDIWMDKPVKGPDGMRAANGKLFLAENGAGKIDMVTVSGDTAAITVLQEGLATPTAIQPTADTLWYGERAGDRVHSMPLPK